MSAAARTLPELDAALKRLDALLAHAGSASENAGPPPGRPPRYDGRLAWLGRAYGLTSFDLDVLVIALAPELDRRYERLYSLLQDDTMRTRPGVGLVLDLLCPHTVARLAGRRRLTSVGPLVAGEIVHLVPAPAGLGAGLGPVLIVDEQILRLLLGQGGLEPALAPWCRFDQRPSESASDGLTRAQRERLLELAADARAAAEPLCFYFQGAEGLGQSEAARELAEGLDRALLVCDLSALERDPGRPDGLLRRALREARFTDAVVLIDRLDALLGGEGASAAGAVVTEIAGHSGLTIVAGKRSWESVCAAVGRRELQPLRVRFARPGASNRSRLWSAALARHGLSAPDDDREALAARFSLTGEQIAAATATTAAVERLGATDGASRSELLFAAARRQTAHELDELATRIEPSRGWDDLVLPPEAITQLREIAGRVTHRERVLVDWGFDRVLPLGSGVTVLFAGASGTGKTMAAEVLAGELGLDLRRVNLAGIVSKYIGETSRNLDRVFRAAQHTNAVLLFDEADALFGKRSQVRDARDRYANIDVAYLLQRMEEYDGLAILATNLREDMDQAFVRRLAFSVRFPFPEPAERRRLWAAAWPAATPVASDVDVDFLAERFTLSGGNIRNAALAAAFLAADDGGEISSSHVLRAVRREYQKLGREASEQELAA